MERETFDYIVVGAGAAGCVLANRLSADPATRVCLVEAGPTDNSPLVPVPLGAVLLSQNRLLSWGYSTEAEPATASRVIPFARGKVIGGTTSINGMVYMRGHPTDYDDWAALGNHGWSYADVLPFFRRAENNRVWRNSPFHGNSGPVDVSDPTHINPLATAFIAAAQQCGIPATEDFNGAQQEGAGIRQLFQRNGKRVSAASAYLKPIRHRRNLSIVTGALCDRVVIEQGRCIGVDIIVDGARRRLAASGEVILSGGTLGSPAILMRSGIGDPQSLSRLGIAPLVDSPEVGLNYQDHVNVMLQVADPKGASYGISPRTLPGLAWAPFEWLLRGRGLLASNFAYAGAFIRSTEQARRPDLQLIFWPVHRLPGRVVAPGHSFGVMAHVLRPKSRGTVSIRDARPESAPLLHTGVLSDPDDVAALTAGLRLARRVFTAPALAGYSGTELAPGADADTDEALERYVRETAIMGLHCAGTCRMGADRRAVVRPDLRVNGVQGLRVADASIMPTLIGGNTAAPTIMIGEKAADLILA